MTDTRAMFGARAGVAEWQTLRITGRRSCIVVTNSFSPDVILFDITAT